MGRVRFRGGYRFRTKFSDMNVQQINPVLLVLQHVLLGKITLTINELSAALHSCSTYIFISLSYSLYDLIIAQSHITISV